MIRRFARPSRSSSILSSESKQPSKPAFRILIVELTLSKSELKMKSPKLPRNREVGGYNHKQVHRITRREADHGLRTQNSPVETRAVGFLFRIRKVGGDVIPGLLTDLPSADTPDANTALRVLGRDVPADHSTNTGDENGFIRHAHEVVPQDDI